MRDRVRGDGQFASGGDIDEFAEFRFDDERCAHFHEEVVAPALHAMLDCDIPLFAQIEGACIGGGLEIAACCDIRVCGSAAASARRSPSSASRWRRRAASVAPRGRRRCCARCCSKRGCSMPSSARERGLVHAVVPIDEVRREAAARPSAGRAVAAGARAEQAHAAPARARRPQRDERAPHFATPTAPNTAKACTPSSRKRPPRFQRG
jgi:enoyl-CoA hydratase/carnithine racemase